MNGFYVSAHLDGVQQFMKQNLMFFAFEKKCGHRYHTIDYVIINTI